ncbi:hypothetical protein ADK67_18635 [Saccharothrix sp. NRRL B-16348]|uniref:DUF1707 SHOCT-like domain-containing protein n=1 Tax=Saccharothrix sp. NRRL B-16348 TaxID=1415542 RepID=UPI0006AF8BA0|nr:DUF1707 domain-containing protein [Saccharothrix sp. NRRL B-16348]KOX24570.1 hypothetical protein ADK67_18635 [Saccharothrix sp. NRRL B-16348]
MEPTSTPAHRASDTDREHTAARLRDAVGEGRLTLAEADERIAAAYAAVHHHDLAALTADLPAPPPPATPPARHRPPVLPIVLLVLAVAWIASPLPFPWPLLLIALLVHRGLRHRRRHDPITPAA